MNDCHTPLCFLKDESIRTHTQKCRGLPFPLSVLQARYSTPVVEFGAGGSIVAGRLNSTYLRTIARTLPALSGSSPYTLPTILPRCAQVFAFSAGSGCAD